MLHRARDAQRNVDRRLDGFPGLADLERVRFPAGIDHRAAGADGGAQLGGQLIDQLEILGRPQAAPTADDDGRIFELGAARFLRLAAQHPGDRLTAVDRVRQRFQLRGAAGSSRLRGKRFGTNQDQRRRLGPRDRRYQQAAAEHR